MKGYDIILKLPRGRVSYYLLHAYEHWSGFFEVVADAWWQLRFERRHRLTWGKGHVCHCGFDYGAIEHDPEDGWDVHRELAKDQEWDRRWR